MMPRALWLFAVRSCALLASALTVLCPAPPAVAQPIADEVPEALRDWIPWVRAELGETLCTQVAGTPGCAWPGELHLELDARGGRFEQRVFVEARLLQRLPGGPGSWPEDVLVDGRPRPVIEADGVPAVVLDPGRYAIEGKFVWSRLPEVLDVGPLTGIVDLVVGGRAVPLVRREAGQLWLKGLAESEGEATAADEVKLAVFRQIRDGSPMVVETRLSFRVSGRPREILLLEPNLKDTMALAVQGDLALSLERSGALRVQLVPGRHELTLLARRVATDGQLRRSTQSEPWPAQEVWTWHPDTLLRVVELSGVPGVDPSRTDLPSEWKADAAFVVGPGEGLTLKTTRRGQERAMQNRVDVVREFWLDEAAQAFTVRDQLSGSLGQGFRLDLLSGALGQVRVSQQDQVITKNPRGPGDGVEVRDAALSLEAVSRVPRRADLAAVGWSEDANSLAATVHLPPGWDVLWATGVDEIPQAWLARWNLFAVFFVLLLSVAMFRLSGPLGGGAAFAALVLVHGEDGAPRYVWMALVVLSVLHALIGHQLARRILRVAFWSVGLLVLVQLVTFSVGQVRHALYPHLDAGYDQPMSSEASRTLEMKQYMAPEAPEAAPAPAAVDAPQEQAIEEQAGEVFAGRRGGGAKEGGVGAYRQRLADSSSGNVDLDRKVGKPSLAQQVPADAIVQTGPGIPDTVARSFSLGWSGPVVKDHRMTLVLMPPWMMRLVTMLRLLALGVLGYSLWRSLDHGRLGPLGGSGYRPVTENPRKNRRRAAGALVLLLGVLLPGPARGEPTDERLAELSKRLQRPPACGESCLSVPRMTLGGDTEVLRLEMVVHAAARAAYRLPGPLEALGRIDVLLDGKPATDLRLEPDGALHLRLDAGVHRVRIDARLPSDRVTLEVGTVPQRISVETKGWSVSGVGEDGRVQGGTLVFQRDVRADRVESGSAADSHVSVLPYFSVERRFELGLTGLVTTRVSRKSDPSSPEVLRLPLLPGEHVTTPGVEVSEGVAVLTFPREESEREIESTFTLPKAEGPLTLTLSAPSGMTHSEVWSVQCGVVWHCDLEGLVPTSRVENGRAGDIYHPWPGEKLQLSATWPKPSPGQSLTIESASLDLTPGVRMGRGQLTVRVRTSQSVLHPIDLPPGARLEEVLVDGAAQAARADGNRVVVSISPGSHEVVLRYHEPRGLSAMFRSAAVSVGAPGTNFRVTVSLPGERWLLLAGGPAQGPAILFWGYLVLIALAAFLLPRLPLSPLKAQSWFLLGLGLTQVPAIAAVFVVGWFFALALRARWAHVTDVRKDIGQVLLLLYTAGFLLTLTVAVYQGLVSSPDMEVEGAGSSAEHLVWYLDRGAAVMPRVWVYSVSIWVWRAVMLVWALWLARSLLGWLRVAWQTSLEGGFWSPPRRKKGAPAEAPTPTEETKSEGEPAVDDLPRESVPELDLDPPRTASQRPADPDDER
jgi:hypothetical protein